MNIDEIQTELQKFADAHSLNIDVQKVLETMDAGDFVAINSAMDEGDNRTILQILQKYRAQLSESFGLFESTMVPVFHKNALVSEVRSMGIEDLHEHLKHCGNVSTLSIQEMRTLVYEDITSSLPSSVTQTQVNNPQQDAAGQQNPDVAAKLKQQDIQRNSGNTNFKVSVPGTNGSASVQNVLGVDVGDSPDKSLVVTQDQSKPGQVQVFPMNSVNTVNEDGCDEVQDAMVPAQELSQEEEVLVLPDEGDMEEPELSQEEIVAMILAMCAKLKG